jgi:hypothetical protein
MKSRYFLPSEEPSAGTCVRDVASLHHTIPCDEAHCRIAVQVDYKLFLERSCSLSKAFETQFRVTVPSEGIDGFVSGVLCAMRGLAGNYEIGALRFQ